ncbi:Carboxypeptidase regulatory-like domain-containing protein [Singulisphaera sp. GP187]|uniref:carboxypeptidase-like regulatory domain-containing protein n=1 Tax=Singulisphaera sp. GP187 TaxID=1882752 RepID=UPI000925BA6A|nr:carboxypeptidase-like regulatory domain-containing protein [Singulisphaera sp. GP187]SIO32692.1 Carboxypeptidase regulatory-like domain-containing protein [Singulisphaera sp. GP187]
MLTLTPLAHKVAGSVVDPQGRPIAGVRVMGRGLNYEESNFFLRSRHLEEEGDPLGSGVSDSEGRFTLTLPAGTNVTLAFRHPRWVSPRIDVAEDEKTIDPVTLQPAGSISGRVRDLATGAPVAGARVGAQFLDSPSLTNGVVGDAVSDAQGKFTLDSLEAGVYNVCLDDISGRPRATANAVAAIRVRSGEESPAELKVFDGIPLQGVVVDATTTQPLPDVLVCGQGPARPLSGNAIHASYSDERGQFTFFVPPGENSVYLLSPDVAMRGSRLGSTTVTVPENGKVPPIRLVGPVPKRPPVVRPGRGDISTKTSEGRSRRILSSSSSRRMVPEGRTVIGKVLDAEGGPLVGATIAARVITEHSSSTVSTVVSDREGTFIAKGLPHGEVTMIATRPGRVRRNDSLRQLVPGDRSTVEFTFGPVPADAAPLTGRPTPATNEPVPPSRKDRLVFVNLDPKANEFLADGPGGQGDDLNRLTQGIHAFDGVFYRIGERLIHLRAQAAPGLPDSVSAIAVGTRADRVQILHSARGDVPLGTEVGRYTVHYADGTSERIPAVYGRNLGGWYSSTLQPPVNPTHARVAWAGSNDLTDRPGSLIKIHLFTFTWKNPHPQRVITAIDVTSTTTKSELVLAGITLERDTSR